MNSSFSTPRRRIAATALALVAAGSPVHAQSDKPLRIVVPLSAGSTVDAVARAMGPQLGKT